MSVRIPQRWEKAYKWRVRPAKTREGKIMPRVFELRMPGGLGVFDRYISIADAINAVEGIEKRLGLTG